uniref:Uncharacterized protein n=1 Tax=Cucumis melo TaxID=3656 RepID=A0A9I9EJ42_CUCME
MTFLPDLQKPEPLWHSSLQHDSLKTESWPPPANYLSLNYADKVKGVVSNSQSSIEEKIKFWVEGIGSEDQTIALRKTFLTSGYYHTGLQETDGVGNFSLVEHLLLQLYQSVSLGLARWICRRHISVLLSTSQFGSDTTCHNRNLSNTIVRHLFCSVNKSAVQYSKSTDKLAIKRFRGIRAYDHRLNAVALEEEIPAINRNPFEGKKVWLVLYFLTDRPTPRRRKKSITSAKIQIQKEKSNRRAWGKRQMIRGGKRNSGNKEPEVNPVCSPKIPSIDSSLNELKPPIRKNPREKAEDLEKAPEKRRKNMAGGDQRQNTVNGNGDRRHTMAMAADLTS